MKTAIIYYSHSGNTKKIADILSDYLKQAGEVEAIGLQAQDETANFFRQSARAFRHKRAKISQVNFDLDKYDLICFASPVWAFGPAPAMNTYLDKCFNVGGKEIILFTTYGSGTGNERCLRFMQDILARKGAGQFKQFSIQQLKVNDKEFVLSKIKAIKPLSPNG